MNFLEYLDLFYINRIEKAGLGSKLLFKLKIQGANCDLGKICISQISMFLAEMVFL